ncbi:MAG: DUF4330 domain-containing protein [Clostridia bacterium]|nr:DUF4330 domain-containing protein [Clostridia bacterium]
MIKNGKLFGKINLFDFAVIILILILIFGIGYKFLVINKEEQKNTVTVTYDLYIESVRDLTVNAFHVGDTVYHYKLDQAIGQVADIQTQPAENPMDTPDGTVVNAPVEGRFDLTVSVTGTAVLQDDGNLMMGKAKIVEGTEIRASTQLANCTATIKNVQWQ